MPKYLRVTSIYSNDSMSMPIKFFLIGFTVIFLSAWVSSNVSAGSLSDNTDGAALENEVFSKALKDLATTKLKGLPNVIGRLSQSGREEDLLPLFQAMLEARLYSLKSNRDLVIIQFDDGVISAVNALNKQSVDVLSKSSLRKIKVNNRIRKLLRYEISRLTLFSDDAALRSSAVETLIADLTPANIVLLQQAQSKETVTHIRESIMTGLALANLFSDKMATRLASIDQLEGNLRPKVYNALTALSHEEMNPEVNKRLDQVITDIDHLIYLNGVIETLFFGLSLGSVLLLAAIGLSITFGVMGVINMAHGELLMLGAYTTYVVQLLMPNHLDLSLFVAIPAAFFVSATVGILIERGVIRFLKGRPLETLLATFGISLILQQLVRSIFTPLNRSVSSPSWMSGSLDINPVLSLTYNRLFIIIFSLLVFAALLFIIKRTALGLYVRAVSQNRNMASAMGVKSNWVDAMTFGLGSGIAGIAGVALSQLTNVGPNLGQAYIIDSFMVVVFGGVGNLWGTLVGGFTLGVANKFLEPAFGAVLAKIMVLIFIILFIQKRPGGLFPQKGRAIE